MLSAVGPELAETTNWDAEDSSVTGELADIFIGLPGVHKWAHYLPIYERILAAYRNRPIRMLEVGVYKGGSLKLWREYLPEAEIVGIDINPECKQYDDPGRRVHVRVGSQADPEFLSQVVREFGHFDVILDDGSHQTAHMIKTFQHLFSSVSDGGIYIVEDIHANYWFHHRDSSISFVEFTKYLIDAMHAHYHMADGEINFRVGHPQRFASIAVPNVTPQLSGIEFFDSIAVFHRQARKLPRSIHQ
jgi:hypothetical protein